MIITDKIIKKLFDKLKSQTILYNLLAIPSHDATGTTAYCVAYSIGMPAGVLKEHEYKYKRLYFRSTTKGIGWTLTQNEYSARFMVFDPEEKVNRSATLYRCVVITPEVLKELLRQFRTHK